MSRMATLFEPDVQYQAIYRSEVAWVGTVDIPATAGSSKHQHDYWEFIEILSGEGFITMGNQVYPAGKGDLFIYPPGVAHCECPDDRHDMLSTRVLCIINTGDMYFMQFWPIGDDRYSCIRNEWISPIFKQITDRMLNEFAEMKTAYTVRLKSLSIEWQSYLVMYAEEHSGKNRIDYSNEYVVRSREFIRNNYQQNIRLTDIAANSFVSTYYLSHIFKERTGYTPMNYLTNLRIEKAKELLKGSEYSISQISQMVGYEDLQHFSNSFKKHTGHSPRHYRQQHQTQSSETELEE